MGTISLILHVTSAVILVGPQVLMFFAVVPATWLIEDDEQLKRNLLKVVAGRFGILSVGAIGVLLLTGLFQYFTIVPAHIRVDPFAYNFGIIFTLKMVMLTALLILIYVHTYRFGGRIRALSDRLIALEGDPATLANDETTEARHDLERARLQSFSFSVLILGASLITLWLGVALGHESFAWAQLAG